MSGNKIATTTNATGAQEKVINSVDSGTPSDVMKVTKGTRLLILNNSKDHQRNFH